VSLLTAGTYSAFQIGSQGAVTTKVGIQMAQNSTLTNYGTISGFTGGSSSGAIKTYGDCDIANFGSISGYYGVVLGSTTDNGDQLNNMGTIFGNHVGVQMRGTSEAVLNAGTISSTGTAVDIYGEYSGP